MSEAELKKYRVLPYKRHVEKVTDAEGTYFVCQYPELPGLAADGGTRAEAVKNAQDAFDDYISARLHWGEQIPEPQGARRVKRGLAREAPVYGSLVAIDIQAEEAEFLLPPNVEKRMAKVLKTPATSSEAEASIETEALAVA